MELDTFNIKLSEENIGRTFSDINHSNIFFYLFSRRMEIKTKINKWASGTYLNSNLLHSKGNNKQNEKTTHELGENINICK